MRTAGARPRLALPAARLLIEFDEIPGGTRFRVRVQPRASRTELAGEWEGCLRIRIAAPPVDGAANDALLRFLARTLTCPRSAVRITSGDTARTKRIEVEGLTPDQVAARLA